jgi:hypothetical protein
VIAAGRSRGVLAVSARTHPWWGPGRARVPRRREAASWGAPGVRVPPPVQLLSRNGAGFRCRKRRFAPRDNPLILRGRKRAHAVPLKMSAASALAASRCIVALGSAAARRRRCSNRARPLRRGHVEAAAGTEGRRSSCSSTPRG